VSTPYQRPRLIESGDVTDGLRCRSVEQTAWLRRYALQANAVGTSRVLVVTEPESPVVVAYYAWCMASISMGDAPSRLRKGAGRYPQPVALLTRLGVSTDHEGKGLGAAMLQDVMARTIALGTDIGCRGLLIHAESPEARDFYLHLVPELETSPTDELHRVLMMKDMVHTLRA
jgi:GNAT superfamily N-acetyltransferase